MKCLILFHKYFLDHKESGYMDFEGTVEEAYNGGDLDFSNCAVRFSVIKKRSKICQ